MTTPRYNPNPCYSCEPARVVIGWHGVAAAFARPGTVIALDGPASVAWEAAQASLVGALRDRALTVTHLDVRSRMLPYDEIVAMTSSAELEADPDFESIPQIGLAALFEDLSFVPPRTPGGVTLVSGPGAALLAHDAVWYLDLPKRYAEAKLGSGEFRNLGQRAGDEGGTSKRLFYVDWPLLDRHRDLIAADIDVWVDVQDPAVPKALDGPSLRAALAQLATMPFRTRPTFNSTPWGGTWGKSELGMNIDSRNTALGYELIAPESGILLGPDPERAVEVPFQMLVALEPEPVMGHRVVESFGTSFPIRFDYLDTVGGGNLSVHCHPQPDYMREVFGWPYTQHESYYFMRTSSGSEVFLGLRPDADIDWFRSLAESAQSVGEAFELREFVNVLLAQEHQLYLVPAGTPHGSGRGNVVLEISATPYLYSLRVYDWLRRDDAGRQRPVHVEHAFLNLSKSRNHEDLVQKPATVRSGRDWHEEVIGSHDAMFFDVRRLVLTRCGAAAELTTDGAFVLMNVVEGTGVLVESAAGASHPLAYAETIVVPAAVGHYTVRSLGPERTRVVTAAVRQ